MTNGARVYRLTVRGVASDLIATAFDDVRLSVVDGNTQLFTEPVDQAMLFGLLRRVEALGLVLLDVRVVRPPDAQESAGLT